MTAPENASKRQTNTRVAPTPGEDGTPRTSTRQRVIDAAIECILERGFYRASSNEIARRAGFTWGAIQRQFGTREAVLSEAYRHGTKRLLKVLQEAEITGDTAEERIDSLFEALRSFYDRPELLAYLQIVMNFVSDPATSQDTVATIHELEDEAGRIEHSLVEQVFGRRIRSADRPIANVIYFTARDFWIGKRIEEVTATATRGLVERLASLDDERRLLVKALTPLVDAAVVERRASRLQLD